MSDNVSTISAEATNIARKHALAILAETLPDRQRWAVDWYIATYNEQMASFIQAGYLQPLGDSYKEAYLKRMGIE